MGFIRKYQGGWQPPAGYLPYVPKKKAKYGRHPFFMPKNELHGQVGQLQSGAPGIGQHMAKCEKNKEIFWAQYQEHYTGEENTEVQPIIAGIMHIYNKKISELRISNVCKLAGVKIY